MSIAETSLSPKSEIEAQRIIIKQFQARHNKLKELALKLCDDILSETLDGNPVRHSVSVHNSISLVRGFCKGED